MAANTRPAKKRAPVLTEETATAPEQAPAAVAPEVAIVLPAKASKPVAVESVPAIGGSTPPRRGTVTKKAAPKKAAPAAKASVPKKATVTEVEGSPVKLVEVPGEGQRFVFDMEPMTDTKSYARFRVPGSSGCLGTLYLPKGTTWVRIAFGAGDE